MLEGKDGRIENVRAYIQGKYVYVRADHPMYTADQLMRHELGHDMIAKGEVTVNKVTQRLTKLVGEENVETVIEYYAAAYGNTGLTTEEIWEEIVCDSLGDMNIFAGDKVISEFMSPMTKDIKAVTESETKAPTQTRGSPEGKASRDFGEYTEKQYNNFGWVRANNVVSKGYWDNFTRNYADAVHNKNYDRITEAGEYMIEIYDESLPEREQVIDHIVYAKGSIKSPTVTRIVRIYEHEETKLDEIRRDVYETERAGVQRQTEGVFEAYTASDFGGNVIAQRSVSAGQRYNNQFGTKRSGSSKAASRVKEYVFDEDGNEVSRKYSRELDSLGNELTKEQAEYFKDSKVRGADGKLLVVYHGTNTEFYTFENGHKRTRGRLNFGEGYYFASSKSYAENYISDNNGRILETYVAVNNPYSVIGNEFTEWEMDDIRSKLSTEDRALLNYDNVNEYLVKLGYDGIIGFNYSGTTKSINAVVAFNTNQIKLTSNKAPTSNPDIRYSRELDLIDYINEKTRAERANMTKAQLVAKARSELESMKVGTGEIMAVQKVADKLFEQYGGEASISEFRYAMYEATRLALMEEGFDAAYEVINEIAKNRDRRADGTPFFLFSHYLRHLV